jgi:gamma-glutamyltranspeptidase/glutathione hydrolase
VLQVISNRIDFGMNLQEAVDAPRVHHQWLPDVLFVEHNGVAPETRAALVQRGHKVAEAPMAGGYLGDIELVGVGDGGERLGVSDRRQGGAAVGE